VRKPEKHPLGRVRRLEDNIGMYLMEIGCKGQRRM
jgi:hypothetical protein